MILFGRRKKIPLGGIGPSQNCMDEVKRLRRVNRQLAEGWAGCVEKLRDAEAYIVVLEEERRLIQWKSFGVKRDTTA